jgi:hypothetical protein
MLLRWIFTAILVYMIYRFVARLLGGGQKKEHRQRPQFDRNQRNGTNNSSRKKNLDQIEDAEFEDITEKEKK